MSSEFESPDGAWGSWFGWEQAMEEERNMKCRAHTRDDVSARCNIRLLASFSKEFEKQNYTVMIERMDLKTESPNSNFDSVIYIQPV